MTQADVNAMKAKLEAARKANQSLKTVSPNSELAALEAKLEMAKSAVLSAKTPSARVHAMNQVREFGHRVTAMKAKLQKAA